jgi:hypothetical protein
MATQRRILQTIEVENLGLECPWCNVKGGFMHDGAFQDHTLPLPKNAETYFGCRQCGAKVDVELRRWVPNPKPGHGPIQVGDQQADGVVTYLQKGRPCPSD